MAAQGGAERSGSRSFPIPTALSAAEKIPTDFRLGESPVIEALKRDAEAREGLIPLSPEALKQEGYARNRLVGPVSPNLTWEERYPTDTLYVPTPAIMIMERAKEDNEDPAYLSVNGDENFQRYAGENEDELRMLDAKLQKLGMQLPAAGTRLATWGGRGHAFEIARDRVCIYMCFENPGYPRTILEFRFRRNGEKKLLVWDYGRKVVESEYHTISEHASTDYGTGFELRNLIVSGGGKKLIVTKSGAFA